MAANKVIEGTATYSVRPPRPPRENLTSPATPPLHTIEHRLNTLGNHKIGPFLKEK